jgi:glycosyltransferase involved in cell wall biosynthesis
MKLLFINSIGKNKFGGGEKWMVKAARGLSGAGHVVFLASKSGSEILKHAERAGVRTKVFNVHWDFSPINTLKIARFLVREQIDVLVCNLNKDVRVAGLAARLIKTPVVIARHGVQLCGKKKRHEFSLKRLADGILTNTETIRNGYRKYGWFDDGFVSVVYNGIEDKSGVIPHDFSTEYPGKKIIFSAGRLSEQKGFSTLIEAARILFDKRNDLVFLVAGKGSLEASLKRQAEKAGLADRFRFLGFISEIDPYLKGCDLFVLASIFEGMPNVVMEAMAVGKAVVATDVNGVRELMENGVTGVIVPPKNPRALADEIGLLIDDPATLERFGKNGLNRVRTSFTIDKMIGELEIYFQQKLDAHRNR